jgi:hypothetical protein
MTNSTNQERKSSGKKFKTTPLGLEQLESRLMNAVSGIEQNLQLLLDPNTLGSTQLVGSINVQSVNNAPTIRTQPRLVTGTEVRGASAVLTALGSDDQGEPNLSYTWSTISSPSGSSVSFSVNGNNQAKRPSVSFNKAGSYVLGLSIADAAGLATTSRVTFNVVQTLSTIQLETPSGTSISSSQSEAVAGNSLQVRIRGFDQFGDAMTTMPTVTWSRVTAPPGGSVVASGSNETPNLTFNRIGDYLLRARGGSATTEMRVSVSQVFTSIAIRNAANKIVTPGTILESNATSQTWTAVGLDQFGGVMLNQPNLSWSAPTAPSGFAPTIQANGNAANVTFLGAGAYTLRAQSGSVSANLRVNVNSVLSQIALTTPDGSNVDPNVPVQNSGTSQRLNVRGIDQFGNTMTSLPTLSWSTTAVPPKGAASVVLNAGVATITFTRAGDYTLRVRGGSATRFFQLNVAQVFTSAEPVGPTGAIISTATPLVVNATNHTLRVRALDQFGQALAVQPSFSWSGVSAPTSGNVSFSTVELGTNIAFTRAGAYTVRATSGSISRNINLSVAQKLTSLSVSGNTNLGTGARQQFVASGTDQFNQPMSQLPTVTWSATGGTVVDGLYSAGNRAGTFAVTAKSGGLTAKADVTLTLTDPVSGFLDAGLGSLVSTLYADSSISRSEMMQILRSAGTDGSVSANELADLRTIVGSGSLFAMPSFVRELAKDVVNSNPANLRFKGATAGNLVAGSSSTLLNNLVDKWFMGADEPEITGSGLAYRTANGNLFNGTPSRADAKQGYLGDCYFIASVAAIADSNATAVRNMFIDNGDGTFTVRFFNGTADYVTVNRRLPSFSNGTLGYSGLGQSITSTATTLWIALAEKAYAQWNETGNAGRDGTNRYSSIEGGWMSNVNRQVLGYNSSNYSFATTSKQTLIDALTSGRAVTLGTTASPGNGFVGGHAYIITGYNASTDTFSTYNPWGTTHAPAASWSQLQANCTMFTVTDSSGTSAIDPRSVRSAGSDALLGNWTTVVTGPSSFTQQVETTPMNSETRPIATLNHIAQEMEAAQTDWLFMAQGSQESSAVSSENSKELEELNAMAIDLAMTLEHLDSILS